MRNLIRRLRGEGESYGLALDGSETCAVLIRRLSHGRVQVERVQSSPRKVWLTAQKDLSFVLRHKRIPADFTGDVQNYVQAFAPEDFPFLQDDPYAVRTDGIKDPDGVLFVHGISKTKQHNLLNDFFMAGIKPDSAAGLVPPATAIHQAVETVEQRTISGFSVILHQGITGMDVTGIRGGRPVLHRSLPIPSATETSTGTEKRVSVMRNLFVTSEYITDHPHFGIPQEVILTGLWPNYPSIPDEIEVLFGKSRIRYLTASDKIVSDSLTAEDICRSATAIGAAALGMNRGLAAQINFLAEPNPIRHEAERDSVYDKLILGSAAAMLALAFVTANAILLDRTKSRMEKVAENRTKIEQLCAEFGRAQTSIQQVDQVLSAVAVRLDASKTKTYSIPLSISKLTNAVTAAAPDGITLDKIEYGTVSISDGGAYANFFTAGPGGGQGGTGAGQVTISGTATLPDYAILYQDALREALGVSVELVRLGREGDRGMWSAKPHRFVIALRGVIRNV